MPARTAPRVRSTPVSAELVALNAALSEMRVQQSSAESSMQEIRARAETVDTTITESEERLAALHTECEELDAMLHDTAEYIQNAENTVQGHEMRVQQRRKRAEAVKAEADRQMLDAKEKERRAGLLEDLERNLEGFTQSVKTVMRESTRGQSAWYPRTCYTAFKSPARIRRGTGDRARRRHARTSSLIPKMRRKRLFAY